MTTRKVKAKAVVGPEKISQQVANIEHKFVYRVDGEEIELLVTEWTATTAAEDVRSKFVIQMWGYPNGGGWDEEEQVNALYDTIEEALEAATAYLKDVDWEERDRCEECGMVRP